MEADTRQDGGRSDAPVECPYCRLEVDHRATRCAHCGEVLEPGLSDMQSRILDFERRRLVVEMKEELQRWYRAKFIGAGAIGIAISIFFGLGVHNYLAGIVESKVQDEVGTAKATIIKSIKSDVSTTVDEHLAGVTAQVGEVRARVEKEADRLVKISDTATQAESAFAKFESRFEGALRRLTLRSTSFSPVQPNFVVEAGFNPTSDADTWRPSVVEPVSISRHAPKTVYRRDGDRVRLEWRFHPPSADDYSFVVQISQSESFDVEHHAVSEANAGFLTHDVELPRGHGPVYWRVRALNQTRGTRSVWSDTATFEVYDDALDRIRRTGIVRIGTSSTPSGKFGRFVDGRLTGFDIELARAVVAQAGARLQATKPWNPSVRFFEWSALLRAPSTHEVDMIISTITIRDGRRSDYEIEFSNAYHTVYSGLITKLDAVPTAEQLPRMLLAAQRKTTGLELARRIATAQPVGELESVKELCDQVEKGSIDGAITDFDVAEDMVATLGLSKSLAVTRVDHVLERDFFEQHGLSADEYGIAIAADEVELLLAVNRALEALDLDEMKSRHGVR